MVQMKRCLGWALMVGILLIPSMARAQIEPNLSTYTGQNANGYLAPLDEALAATLQSGMFRSAAIPKSKFTFSLGAVSAFVKFADGDRVFTARTEEGFFPASEVEAPTVIGDTMAVSLAGQGGAVAVFPGGLDVSSFGLAVPQLTVGGYAGTEATVRFIAVETGDADVGDLSLIGVGLRHSLSQYFLQPPVDLAVGGMWQRLKVGDDLVTATALSLGAQASKRFNVLEPYIGLSYDTFKSEVEYKTAVNADEKTKIDLDDVNNVHILVGLGINVSILHLYGEIGSADRTVFAAGLSLGN